MTYATLPPPPPSTVHPDRAAMLRQILEWPDDDAPRLVFADWLDDIGDNYAAHTLRWFLDRPEYRQSVGIDSFVPSMTNYFGSGEVCGVWNRGFGCEIRLPCSAFMQHAASIFAAHPVTRVVLTDKRPDSHFESGSAAWNRLSRHVSEYQDYLPPGIYRLLPELPESEFDSEHLAAWAIYPSLAIALDALSAACVSYGRSLAGLQPLPQPITKP